jgi:alkanesulfonate monooxygenase SsuD/methylene tetrahydromethanopterin reductase-like flavin-dependent oxidoreductase (luciferase family)
VKVSYLCSNSYIDSRTMTQGAYPYPPALYDPETGTRSVLAALEHARLADELGFDWVSVSEHHFAPGLLTPNPLVFAGALTQVVRRAKIAVLGPIVSINNPVRVAEEIALLDLLSGGRVVVFLLRGTPNEFTTYYVNPDETRARTEEAVALIIRALTEPRPFGWEGRYFRYPTVAVWPGPTQRPHPPIFSSGNSLESATFAARQRHGLAISFRPPSGVAEAVAHYKAECARNGWQPSLDQILYRGFIAVGETDAEAEVLRARFAASRGAGTGQAGGRNGAPPPPNGVFADAKGGQADGAGRAGEGFGLGSLQFWGTPASLVEQIRAFHETTGVGVLDLIFTGGPQAVDKALRTFGSEVLPRVREIGVSTADEQERAGVRG